MCVAYTAAGRLKQARVYVIGPPDGPVKIGFTHLLQERLVNIQCASPVDVTILAAASGTRDDERMLHVLFAGQKIRGEWFDLNDELRAFIQQTADTGVLAIKGNNTWRNVLDSIGRRELRREFNLSDTALTNWIKRGIPDNRINAVIALAEREGVSLQGLV